MPAKILVLDPLTLIGREFLGTGLREVAVEAGQVIGFNGDRENPVLAETARG